MTSLELLELHLLITGIAGMPPCPVYVVGAGDGIWGFKHTREAVCQLSHTLRPHKEKYCSIYYICVGLSVGVRRPLPRVGSLLPHVGFRVELRLSELPRLILLAPTVYSCVAHGDVLCDCLS